MGVPKRKPSRSRQRMRRAYNSVMTLPQLSTCPQCAAPYVPHRVCPACGFYKGRQVINVEAIAYVSEKSAVWELFQLRSLLFLFSCRKNGVRTFDLLFDR